MINYYATPLVRASVVKKLCALMSISEDKFVQYFRVFDLKFDQWNRINGLEVMPIFSAHPVETSILYFRTEWAGGHRTYAHLADIASLKGPGRNGDDRSLEVRDQPGISRQGQEEHVRPRRPQEDRRRRRGDPRGRPGLHRGRVEENNPEPFERGIFPEGKGDRFHRGLRPDRHPHPEPPGLFHEDGPQPAQGVFPGSGNQSHPHAPRLSGGGLQYRIHHHPQGNSMPERVPPPHGGGRGRQRRRGHFEPTLLGLPHRRSLLS